MTAQKITLLIGIVGLAVSVAECGSSAAPDTAIAMSHGCRVIDGVDVDVYAEAQTTAACNSALAALGYSGSSVADRTPGSAPDLSQIACSGSYGSAGANTRALVLINDIAASLCNSLTADGLYRVCRTAERVSPLSPCARNNPRKYQPEED
jgi:hypothetical protein